MAQATNDKTVVGVFEDYNAADRVVRDLTNAGIPRDSIQVQSNFMTGAAGRSDYREDENREGGISGFFHRLFGGDETDAGHYAEAHRRGNAIVTVTLPNDDQAERAIDIMNSAGAIDIDRQVDRYRQEGYQNYDASAEPYSHEQALSERDRYRGANEGTSIPVVEEELQVGKRAVRRGGVRVYSRVVERPVTESIELREEHVRVDRRPADRALSEAEMQGLRDQTIEVTETVEEPIVKKRSRVREEVVVGKETTSRTEKVTDNVRHTEVNVERMEADKMNRLADADAGSGSNDYRADFRRDWESRYASSGDAWETYQPAYDYGYRTASDPRYRGRDWSDVEDDLKTDYMRNNPNSTWDRMKGAVRYGWEKVTGKR